MSEERNAIPLIITGICTILGTVGAIVGMVAFSLLS